MLFPTTRPPIPQRAHGRRPATRVELRENGNVPVRGPQRRAMRNGGARKSKASNVSCSSRAIRAAGTHPARCRADRLVDADDRRCPRRARVGWRSRPPRAAIAEERARAWRTMNSSASSVVTRRTPTRAASWTGGGASWCQTRKRSRRSDNGGLRPTTIVRLTPHAWCLEELLHAEARARGGCSRGSRTDRAPTPARRLSTGKTRCRVSRT